jgi:hypothetical protein
MARKRTGNAPETGSQGQGRVVENAREQLKEELQTLRQGPGLTPGKLKSAKTLRRALARKARVQPDKLSDEEALELFQKELDSLEVDDRKAAATRNAYAYNTDYEGKKPQSLDARRRFLMPRYNLTTERSVANLEDPGIDELVNKLAPHVKRRLRPSIVVSVSFVLALIVASVVGRMLLSDSPAVSSRFTCYDQIPAEHVGTIWLSIHPTKEGRSLRVELLWGGHAANELVDQAMSLLTAKGPDYQPLSIEAHGAATISCGIGTPPDEVVRDINGDWS